ncbi:hypothetical protein ACIA8K_21140 [Catenuloplanes sp. NPDC051500]|uniref:hypothetical protein n=1 Tax=Catenuloplanes sp. NPDC051500 TaxID=3363959 RepID=UPI0037BCF966
MAELEEQVRQGVHDLANLLGIAANYLQFLEDDLEGVEGMDEARQHIERITLAVGRATEVSRRLGEAAGPLTPS